jgi:hypothetical protein
MKESDEQEITSPHRCGAKMSAINEKTCSDNDTITKKMKKLTRR